MKLTKYVLSLSILSAAVIPYAATTTDVQATKKITTGTVTKDVIVRQSSTPKSANLGTLKKGTKVSITKVTTYWYQIKYKKSVAYVSKKNVKLTVKKAAPKHKTSVKSNASIKSNVYYYATPSNKGKALGTLKKGTKIHVNSTSKFGWAELNYNGKKVYVYKTYVNYSTKAPAKKAPAKKTTTKTAEKTTVIATVKSAKKANATIKSNVYFYAAPSNKGKALGTLKKGTKIHVNSTSKFGWVEFDHNGKKSYVYKTYVKFTK